MTSTPKPSTARILFGSLAKARDINFRPERCKELTLYFKRYFIFIYFPTNSLFLDLFSLHFGNCYFAKDRLCFVFGPRHATVERFNDNL